MECPLEDDIYVLKLSLAKLQVRCIQQAANEVRLSSDRHHLTVCCSQHLRTNCTVGCTSRVAAGGAAWSREQHRAPADSLFGSQEGSGAQHTRTSFSRVEQAEQLVRARLSTISAGRLTPPSRGRHAGRESAMLVRSKALLAALGCPQDRVTVLSNAHDVHVVHLHTD